MSKAAEVPGATTPAVTLASLAINGTSLPQAKKKIDLSVAMTAEIKPVASVERLTVRELKGVGGTFTPNLALALTFYGLAYKAEDEFETRYQIIAGALLDDPRVTRRAKKLVFVPAFAWDTHEVVLAPYKQSKFGCRVLEDLKQLNGRFPNYKAFVEWNDQKRRHVVHHLELTGPERDAIARAKWPTQEDILEALQVVAYEDIDSLADDNAEIRTILSATEVE